MSSALEIAKNLPIIAGVRTGIRIESDGYGNKASQAVGGLTVGALQAVFPLAYEELAAGIGEKPPTHIPYKVIVATEVAVNAAIAEMLPTFGPEAALVAKVVYDAAAAVAPHVARSVSSRLSRFSRRNDSLRIVA